MAPTKIRQPCGNCPWRKDAPREFWDPQHLTDIYTRCQDDGLHIMLCHKSPEFVAKPGNEGKKLVCQGWIRVIGFEAIGVRIAAMRGYVTGEEVEDQRPGLFGSFEEMLAANRIVPPKRNKFIP